MKNKKILYLYTRLSPLKNFEKYLIGGGAQKNLIEIAQHMVNKNIEVFIASDEPNHSAITKFLTEIKITHTCIPFQKINLFNMLYSIFYLYRLIKDNKIDIIHSHHRRTTLFAFIVSKITKSKLIHTEHNTFTDKKIFRFFKIKNIIAVSNGVRKNLIDNYSMGSHRITVIYNGVKISFPDQKDIVKCFDQNELKETDRIFSYIGRISYIKGLDYLIESLVDVKKVFPSIKLLIVGDESQNDQGYKDKLLLKVKKLGLNGECLFVGYKKDIRPFICCSEFTILPSFIEGLPIIAIESLMLNRPVIATDVGGTSEIIKNGINGRLIAPKDAKGISNEILQFLKNPESTKRMGLTGKSFAMKMFDQTKMFEKYFAYYKKTITS